MTMTPTPPELVPLGALTLDLRDPILVPGVPAGTRVIAECSGGRFEGERLKGDLKGHANADWVSIGADGTAAIDVRLLLETDDGALIYMTYAGRLNLADQTVYAAPLFETGDERYSWLNGIQAVAKGTTDNTRVLYDIFELR